MLFWFVYGGGLLAYLLVLSCARKGIYCRHLGYLLARISRVAKEKTLLECASKIMGAS